ncbi:MAG: hypothetical protein ACTHM7_14165 [Ginsengibacter sp.]
METKLSSRNEKIKLLNSLKKGTININDAFPMLPEIWLYDEACGIYSRNDQELTEKEFNLLNGTNKILVTIGRSGCIESKDLAANKFNWTRDNRPFDTKQVDKIISALRSIHLKNSV